MKCPFKVPDGASVHHRPQSTLGGDQFLFKFANEWGASVVRGPYTYGGRDGKWELAVEAKDGSLSYEHPVSRGDVRGWLEVEDVDALLAEIAATTDDTPMLPARKGGGE